MHLGAQFAQSHACIPGRPPAHKFSDGVIEADIIVMQLLEGYQGAQQRARLAQLDAWREEKQQRVEVILLRHHPVLAQILRNHRRRNAVIRISAGADVKARRQESELVGIRHGVAGRDLGKAVPAGAGRQLPIVRIGSQFIGRHILPCDLTDRAAVAVRDGHAIGNESLEEPAPCQVSSFSSNSRRMARIFLRSSMPSRMVSSHNISPERPFIICAPTSSEANSG